MEALPPDGPGGFFGWVQRKPKLSFWLTAGLALLVGMMIGAGSASDSESLDSARSDAKHARIELAAVSTERDDLRNQLDSTKQRADTAQAAVKKLSAKNEVPDFTRDGLATARSNDVVEQLDWKIRTVREITSNAPPGRVIAQRPKEGATLKAGRSITLTVAKKPPPKPKQWVTIASFAGSGSKKTDEFTLPDGPRKRVRYTFTGDSNAIMELVDPDDELGGELLFNEIGDYSDTTRLYQAGRFYLDIEGAQWQIQVQAFKRP